MCSAKAAGVVYGLMSKGESKKAKKAIKEGKEDIVAVNVSGFFLSSPFLFLFWLFRRTKKKNEWE